MNVLSVLFSIAIFQLSDASCPKFWTQFGSSCYDVIKDSADWFEAKEFCRDFNGYLTEIGSKAEDDFVDRLLKNSSLSTNLVWIGGTDLVSEGHWIWSDSQAPFTYTNWYPGEPNNSAGKENCMEYFVSQAKWNDHACSTRSPFICETEAGVAPVG